MPDRWRSLFVAGLAVDRRDRRPRTCGRPGTPPAAAFTVLDDPTEAGPRITPYLRDQLDRAWAQDEARQAAFAKVRTEADLLALRKEMRARVLDVIGGLPETQTPLNARIIPRNNLRLPFPTRQ
jgi:hypothetical protein